MKRYRSCCCEAEEPDGNLVEYEDAQKAIEDALRAGFRIAQDNAYIFYHPPRIDWGMAEGALDAEIKSRSK